MPVHAWFGPLLLLVSPMPILIPIAYIIIQKIRRKDNHLSRIEMFMFMALSFAIFLIGVALTRKIIIYIL
jgi:hypothetical protein